MAGFSSQAGRILIRSQAVAGTYQADMASNAMAVKLRSGALASNRDLLIPDPEIGGGRDIPDAYLGAVSWSGDYEFYARMQFLATFLKSCLGTVVTTAPTDPDTTYSHVITPVDSGSLPLMSIEENIGGGLDVYQYTDAICNTFHLEAEANGYLMGTAGIIAKKQIDNTSPASATKSDNTPMIVGTNIIVNYGGVQLPAKSFNFDVNNNIEDDDFRLGSFFLGGLVAKRREVTMSVSIRPEDASLWRQAVYGVSSLHAVGGIVTKDDVSITMETYESIPDSDPDAKYTLEIAMGKAAFQPFSYAPSGDDVIENDIDIQALRPSNADPILTATVTTDAPIA